MSQQRIRNYEVSIWTLQDSFITVLKYSDLENKGQIQDGSLRLNIDGTEELSFKIPMYLWKEVRSSNDEEKFIMQRYENPIWYNVKEGNIIANMRKIKVIFNKMTEVEKKVAQSAASFLGSQMEI